MKARDMDRRERVFAYALLALAVLAFFSLNLLTRVMRDDYSYTFNFVTKERIASFADIFESLGIHYTRVNGRLPVHFFAHLFLWMGKGVFNVVNTAAFALLVTLIYYQVCGTLRDFRPYLWLAGFLGLWLLTPAFGESFLWVTGASNYLYGMLLILLFLVPYRRLAEGKGAAASPLWALAALPGGVLAGWTNENTSVALCFAVCCLIVWRLLWKEKVPLWAFAGFLGCCAGLLLMLLSPGELGRLEGAGGAGGARDLLWRAGVISYRLLAYLWPGILLWFCLFLVFFRRKKPDWKALFGPAVFLCAGLGSLYAMAFPPSMPDRVWSGAVAYLLVSLGLLYRAAGEPRFAGVRQRLLAASLCAALGLAFYAHAAPAVARSAAAFDARESDAAAQLAAGRRDLRLDAVHGSGVSFDAAETPFDITPDPGHWLNSALAHYLGADSVVTKEVN